MNLQLIFRFHYIWPGNEKLVGELGWIGTMWRYYSAYGNTNINLNKEWSEVIPESTYSE